LQEDFDQPDITRVMPFQAFKLNEAYYLNYYYSDPQKLFCQIVVNPKLKLLLERFAKVVNMDKLAHLTVL
jgi:peptide-methionine (S)-S-oxide reductase